MSNIDWEKGVIEKPKNSSETDWDSGTITEPAKDRGFTGALIDGAKSTGRAISSTYNTYTGDGQAVVDNSKEQELANEDKSQDIKNFQSDWAANTGAGTDDEVGLWGAIKGTGKAIIDNPRGAALSVVEQFPNSVPTLAAGWAGAKGGAMAGGAVGSAFGGVGAGPGALIGGAAGFVGGMFLGNTLTETGHKAQEYAADGEFTPDEQSAAMTEGAKKAGAITAVDAITFGIGGKISSTMRRTAENAVEAATRKTLIDAGVDISDAAAVSAARSSQQVAKSVSEAQQNATKIADSLRKRAAEAGVLLTVETIGEGLGEYLGELAATGQASVSEAVLESFLSLGQSSVQSMFNFAKAREKSLTEQEWIDAANGIAPEGMAQEEMPAADGMWDEPTPEAKIDMGQMQGGGVTPAPVFDQQDIDSKLGATPSQQMGINPDAGPLSAAAAQSVDSGLFTGGFTPQAGINQAALEREGVTPPPVLDADQIDRNLGSIDPITGEYMPAPELLDQPNQAVNTGNYEYDRYGNLSKVDGRTVEGYGQNQPRLGFNNKAERSTAPLYEVGPNGVARPSSGEAARSRKERIDLSTLEGRQQTQAQKQPAAMPEQRTPEQSAQHSWDSMNTFERNAAAANILGARGVLAKNTATKAWNKLSAEQQAKLVSGLDAQKGQRWTDPNQKVTDQTGPVLQNRDRTSQDSINQMRGISNNPDYSRLKTSGFLSDGAPVAIDENIKVPASQLGVTDTASAGGKKFNVQYAVVEADQFVTSNSIDGRPNTEYAAGSAGKARAIAGNGRITGLQSAWAKGKADQYKADMAADKMHGIDAAVIEGMKNPILVRLLPQDEVTDNIGDLSNRDEKGKLSPVEQAKTDMGRIDLDSLKFTAEGAIGGEAIHQFRMAQPAAERVSEAEARKRLTSAIFQKAYGNDQLTEIQSGESDDAKSIMSALAQAAPSMSRLEGAGEFDVRPLITQAGIAAVNAARRGTKLADYVQQSEMGIDPMVYPILEMMLNEHGNIRSSKYIGEQLTNMAKLAYDEANSPSSDMFGEKPKRTAEQVIQDALTGVQGYGQINDGRGQESLGQRGRSESDAQMAERPEGGRERPADTGQAAPAQPEAEQGQPATVENDAPETWRSNYIEAAKVAREKGIDPKQHKKLIDLIAAIDAANNDVDTVQLEQSQPQQQPPSLDLTQQTEESRAAAEAEDKARIDAEKKAKDKQDREDKKAREKAADAQAVESSLDRFELGQSADEQLSGQVDMLAGNQEIKSVNKNEPVKLEQTIEDFGEKMAGAIKDQPISSLSKNLTDEEMASQPLSALWPASEPLAIDDDYTAAFSYAARENIPAKPRLKYKVKRWVDTVKAMRELAKAVQDGEITQSNIESVSKTNDAAKGLAAKARLLSSIDRKHWSRIGRVDVSDNAYIFDDNRNKVPSPHTTIMVDGRGVLVKGKYDNDSVTAVIKASLEMAEQSDASKRGQFEIRENRNTGEIFINRKGDKEYRKLKTFPKGSVKEARDFVNNNTNELVAAWEAVKERDNVTKADVRSDTNKERTGIDYRNGEDITSEEFGQTFGFRGVEFGNWVSQGKGQKDRQGMLNAAYDALLDLAAVVGIPPKAVSLNGSLGIAFGSRGKGKASAHYETNNIVINLTKTKGAGSLAHEWFHALDNYFSRRRGVTPFDGNNTAYNKANYITYKPEPMMALKSSLNKQGLRPHLITKAEYDRRAERGVNFDAADWTPDNNHPIGVRPVVEKAFADLVNALDESPMLGRAETIDKGQVEGYWSRIIERAARSFESYVIQRLEDQGITNDYLANVVPVEKFLRDKGRYPYLTAEELKPVAEKFDTLFSAIETREEKEGSFLMFSRHNNQPNNPTNNASLLKNLDDNYPALTDSVVTMLQRGRKGQKGGLVIVDSNNGADIAKAYSKATGMPIAQANRLFSDGESINGFYDTKSGITFLVGPNLDATTAPAVLLHEVTHSQQRSEIDARSMKLINGRAKEKNADLKAFLETVSQRMIDAGEYGNPLESTTYIVEQAIIEGRSQGYTLADSKFLNAIEKTLGATVANIIRDFAKMVRQFALRRGLPINVTLDDLVQYAMASVEQAAKGNIATENKDGMAYSFAGEDALTADLTSLTEAKKQIATDLTPDQVRKNTGWMQGAEGKWRFEIDDSKASFVDAPMLDSYLSNTLTGDKKLSAADQKTLNLLKLKERKMSAEVFGSKDKKTDAWDQIFYNWHQVKQQIQELDRRASGDFMNIGSLLKHDQLFNAYPDMKNIKIRLAVDDSVTMNGFYDRKDNLIEMTAPNKEKLMAGLLHELQHAIQSIEGFARGGSPSQFGYKDATSEYLGRVSNKIIDLLNSNKEFGATVRKVKQEFTKLSNKYPKTTKDGHESVNWDKVPTDESEAYFKLLDQTEKHPEVERWRDLETEYRIARRDGKTLTPFEQYQSLAGEVEARNVESRRHFTEEERREFSPIASEDFQRQDQTIRYSRNAKARVEGEQQFAQTEKAYGGRAAYNQAESDGKTKLNYQQWVQVRTPAFKNWFGDWENAEELANDRATARATERQRVSGMAGKSAKTDTRATGEVGRAWGLDQETGEPRLFFHGTKDSFTEFNLDHQNRKDHGWLGTGIYTVSDSRISESYARLKDGSGEPRVMSFFSNVKNPYIATREEKEIGRFMDRAFADNVTKKAKAAGYDGVVLPFADGSVELVAFDKPQIKSATNNIGTFDGANPDIRYSRAYHGSINQFNKFQLQSIGTGEGAQAFGWGLYFAESRGIAEAYKETFAQDYRDQWIKPANEKAREKLSALTSYADGALTYYAGEVNERSTKAQAVKAGRDLVERNPNINEYYEKAYTGIADMLESGELVFNPKIGSIYEVEIPDSDVLLDYDAKLSDQPSKVKKAINKLKQELPVDFVRDGETSMRERMDEWTGKEFYDYLTSWSNEKGMPHASSKDAPDKKASMTLNDAGIPGLRYLDGISRKGGDGTRNYVIWDESVVSIESINYQKLEADVLFSRTANPASVGAAPNGMAAWDSPSTSKFDDFVYKIQDKHVDTKRVIEAIRDTGKAISDDLDVYLQETLFHGRAAKRTQDFLNKEVNPLVEYMQSVKVEMSDLEEFLHARHAQEANALIAKRDPNMPDGGSGMTNAEAAKYLNSLNGVRRKQFENAAKMVDKIIGGTRETIVSYGLESQKTVDGWTSGFKHYIPLQREDKDDQMGIGQGFSVKGKETKGRTGSTRKVVDILANVMMQRERIIVRGEKNRVAAALLGLAKDNPLPDFWKVDVVPTSRVLDKVTGLVHNQADPMYKSKDNAIVVKVNGQEHAILMNEDDPRAMRMAEALKNLDAAQLEGLIGATASATRYFAAVNTQYNPIFGVTNFVRDIQEAMLHLQSTPLAGQQARLFKNTFTAVGAVMKAERDSRKGNSAAGKWGMLWEDFQNTGGQTGFRDQFSNSVDRGKAIQSALRPEGWADTGLGKLFTAGGVLKAPLEVVRKKAAWLFDLLSDYNTAMENGVRLSAYETGINAGMSKEQAAALAKGLTVNFNRKGQVTQQVGALYAFFNASVQGTARLGQSLFDMDAGKPKTLRLSSLGKKIVSGGVMLGASQAVLLAMAGFDDEEPPEFIRERNIIIPTGGKTYISIPMPLGYHVIANFGRIPTEFALGGGEDSAKHLISLLDVMSDVYNPLGSSGLSMQTIAPTVLDPLAALAENKDFSGRAIAKESFNRQTPGHALARDTASLPATWLAQVINYATGGTEFTRGEFSPTPDQIDYLVGQLTGGVGREATKFLKTGQATASGDDLPWHNIPLVGRFYGDANSDGAKQSAFYNNMDSVRKHAEEVKGLRAAGRSGEAVEYANKHPHAKLHLAARAAEKQVKGMRDRKRELEQAGAPREEIRALEKRMIQRMEQFVELSAVRK